MHTSPSFLCKSYLHVSAEIFRSPSETPGSPTVVVIIGATSITVSWTKAADDGGSPITAYRLLILRGNTEIENKNVTDLSVKQLVIGSLNKSTNYTIKLFARNYVFEGKATEKEIQTKYEGMKMCTKNALNIVFIQFIYFIAIIYLFLYFY